MLNYILISVPILILGTTQITNRYQGWSKQTLQLNSSAKNAVIKMPKKALVLLINANQSAYLIPSLPKQWRFINMSKNIEPNSHEQYQFPESVTNYEPSKNITYPYFMWAKKNDAAYYLITTYNFFNKGEYITTRKFITNVNANKKRILNNYNLKISGRCIF